MENKRNFTKEQDKKNKSDKLTIKDYMLKEKDELSMILGITNLLKSGVKPAEEELNIAYLNGETSLLLLFMGFVPSETKINHDDKVITLIEAYKECREFDKQHSLVNDIL